jgi:hypothetical protein
MFEAIALTLAAQVVAERADFDDAGRAAVMGAVKSRLKDPESARFRWLPRVPGKSVYCGLVNARNSFGGYTGPIVFAVFITEGTRGVSAYPLGMGDTNPRSPASLAIESTCADAGYNILAPTAD